MASIGFVCDDSDWLFLPIQKRIKGLAIMGLCTSDVYPQRTPFRVYSGVNLTAATAA